MSQAESPSLKSDVRQFLESRGAFKVRIANPLFGFEKAGNGSHPLDLMKDAHAMMSLGRSRRERPIQKANLQ